MLDIHVKQSGGSLKDEVLDVAKDWVRKKYLSLATIGGRISPAQTVKIQCTETP